MWVSLSSGCMYWTSASLTRRPASVSVRASVWTWGFGLPDASRDLRLGWRLTSGAGPGFELNLDAVRRELANRDGAEHGVRLTSTVRW